MEFPEWLASKSNPARSSPVVAARSTDFDDRRALAALRSECARVAALTEGNRNHELNNAALRMGQLVAGGQLLQTTVVEHLTEAALSCGLADAEIALVLREGGSGGLAKGMSGPRRVEGREPADQEPPLSPWRPRVVAASEPTQAVEQDDEDEGEQEVEQEDVDAAVRSAFPLLDWHALWADEQEDEWLLEPLIPARRLVALYSPPKVGKSLLMLEIAAGLASGHPVLGAVNLRRVRTLYVDFENDPRGDVRTRLSALGYGPDDLGDLAYLSFPSFSTFDTPTGGAQLLAAATAYNVELVVIDTISRAITGEENANDTWLAFYRNTGGPLKAAGIAVIRLDHSGKDVEKGMRGGSAKYSDVDAVWQMSTIEPDRTFKLLCTDSRFPITEKELVIKRHALPRLWHQVDPEGTYGIFRAKLATLVADLDRIGLPDQASNRVARVAVTEADISASNSLLQAAVRVRQARAEDAE